MKQAAKAFSEPISDANPGKSLNHLRHWITKLYIDDAASWRPLPDWARFYLELGASLRALEASDSRFVLALSLPTRAYAAVLIAAGFTACGALIAGGAPAEHVDRLLRSVGAPVVLYWRGKKYKAQLAEVVHRGGTSVLFGVKPEKGTTIYLSEGQATLVSLSEREAIKLPKRQTGKALERSSVLLRRMLSGAQLRSFETASRLECVALGQVNLLAEEALTGLALEGAEGQYDAGSLQDLLRAHELSRQRKDIPYRSRLLPARASYSRAQADRLAPRLTIFDGAAGFLKWRDAWRGSNQVVALERAETGYELGVATVNEEYAGRLEAPAPNLPIVAAPPGVAMAFFRTRR